MAMFLIIAFLFAAVLVISYAFMAGVLRGVRQAEEKAKAQRHVLTDAGVRDLVTRGRISEAEEIYRAFTGVDVFTAKERIEDIERELRLGEQHDAIAERIRYGDKAGAIKAYQEATGAELDEALAEIERLEKRTKWR